MNTPFKHQSGRRDFIVGATSLSAATMLGMPGRAVAEAPPEVTKIRLIQNGAICLAPQLFAEELLHLEGFSQVEYVAQADEDPDPNVLIASGRADFTLDGATSLVPAIDSGRPFVVLAGVHGGCYELFASGRVRAIKDLKGKSIAIGGTGAADHVYISSMMAYVGMDPRSDVKWIDTKSFDGPMELFVAGKADAFLGFPPQPQQVRAKKVGQVIVNTAQDAPWSQHFCCMLVGDREFVRKYPVATKRALRAILKAADVCARQPERVARYIVSKGYEANYDIALEVVKEVSFTAWRTYNPDDTLRFHALRLHEVGMIKSTPQKIIAQGTDWRFLNELKRELKA